MSVELKEIQKILRENASKKGLSSTLYFLPNSESQKIYGTRTPILNQLAKQYKYGGFELVQELWKSGALEEKILAGKLLGQIAANDPALSLKLVSRFSGSISNWAECDCLGMQSLKPLVKTHALEIFSIANHLLHSENPWQRRLSLVLVEWFTRYKKFHPQIKIMIRTLEHDQEYYVKKAVNWMKLNLKKGK